MKQIILCILFIPSMLISMAWSQDHDKTLVDDYYNKPKKEAGFVFAMAETGTGFGAFVVWPFSQQYHAGVTFDAFFIRDSRQFEYVDYYGNFYSINDVNNVYLFDLMFMLKRRFFAEDMDDSFRPFLSAGFGPIFGMNFPEVDDLENQYRWTAGGFIGGGVDISVDVKYLVSIKAQYRFMPFSKILGETSDHSMFELRFELGRRF